MTLSSLGSYQKANSAGSYCSNNDFKLNLFPIRQFPRRKTCWWFQEFTRFEVNFCTGIKILFSTLNNANFLIICLSFPLSYSLSKQILSEVSVVRIPRPSQKIEMLPKTDNDFLSASKPARELLHRFLSSPHADPPNRIFLATF
jgi:hypothetical protein